VVPVRQNAVAVAERWFDKMKYTYKKMASGGKVGKGYTTKERKGLRRLIEEMADPYAGDVTGGSSVTIIKKSKKKMAAGGIVNAPARSHRDMRAGAGSGVGRLQKTKIQRGR
jgi:hypothetical protein